MCIQGVMLRDSRRVKRRLKVAFVISLLFTLLLFEVDQVVFIFVVIEIKVVIERSKD